MLSDLAHFRSFLSAFSGFDTTEDVYDAGLVQTADRLIKSWCKRDLETQTYALSYSGEGQVDLVLKQRPVQAPVFTGTLTSGSTSFTSMTLTPPLQYPVAANGTPLSGTQNLAAGMPAAVVASTGSGAQLSALPVNTTISSVDSPTQVTLNHAAALSGTYNLVFGIDVYVNYGGGYGDSASGFPATSQLMLGNNYVLKRDQSDGSSKKGLLQRLSGGGGLLNDWWGASRFTGVGPIGSLTASALPRWQGGYGNIFVRWTAGLGIGAAPPSANAPTGGSLPALTTIDPALTDAVNKIAAWIRLTTPRGAPLDSSELSEASRQQISSASPDDPLIGGLSSLIRTYRETSW